MIYIVQPGDTLSNLAKRMLGEARLWPRIWDRNRAAIVARQPRDARHAHLHGSPNWLFPGTVLEIDTANANRPGDASGAARRESGT